MFNTDLIFKMLSGTYTCKSARSVAVRIIFLTFT